MPYTLTIHGICMAQRDRKMERLKQQGGLNRHPERVRAPWFAGSSGFFDARDLAQVKYEMLRQVRVEGAEKTKAAALFGVSRPTFYEAEAAQEEARHSAYRSRAISDVYQVGQGTRARRRFWRGFRARHRFADKAEDQRAEGENVQLDLFSP